MSLNSRKKLLILLVIVNLFLLGCVNVTNILPEQPLEQNKEPQLGEPYDHYQSELFLYLTPEQQERFLTQLSKIDRRRFLDSLFTNNTIEGDETIDSIRSGWYAISNGFQEDFNLPDFK